MDGFVSVKSKNLFSRLNIDISFLQESVSSWEQNATFVEAPKNVFSLKAVNDTAEIADKLMQDFHGKIHRRKISSKVKKNNFLHFGKYFGHQRVKEEQKQYLLHFNVDKA